MAPREAEDLLKIIPHADAVRVDPSLSLPPRIARVRPVREELDRGLISEDQIGVPCDEERHRDEHTQRQDAFIGGTRTFAYSQRDRRG